MSARRRKGPASLDRASSLKPTGATHPWIVQSTAMVNRGVDKDFGPFFLKFCSYFPYNAKLYINGHEHLKRQLAKRGVRS